jgi:hypothetical protein
MQKSYRSLRILAITLLLALYVCVAGLPVHAQDAVRIAHRAVRNKILREASDRYDVRFRSTHTDRLYRSEREVTGTGSFRRHGKSSQRFTYRTIVNTRTDTVHDIDYDIR